MTLASRCIALALLINKEMVGRDGLEPPTFSV